MTAGAVGLYEFMWILNGTSAELSRDDRVSVAEQALQTLLDGQRVRLVWRVWAKPELSTRAESFSPTLSDWNDPVLDEPYLAIEPA